MCKEILSTSCRKVYAASVAETLLNFPWPARIKEKPVKMSTRSSSTKAANLYSPCGDMW
jgi:hypothetical protein